MEYRDDRRGIAPWVWVLIVLAAIILIFVIWWAVAASGPEERVIVTREEDQAPAPQQPPQQPADQPMAVERERPVNIFIERDQPQPQVIVVPQGEQPAQARERLRQVDLPSRIQWEDRMFEPSNRAVSGETVNLRDTGSEVGGNIIYVQQDAERPYNEIYLETEPGSDIYLRYSSTGRADGSD